MSLRSISSRRAVFVRRLGDLVNVKQMRTGRGVCKICVKKACVGDGGELERALDESGFELLSRFDLWRDFQNNNIQATTSAF